MPTTFQEFQADLAKIKAAGQQPIGFGNLDKYPAIHAFQQVQDSLANKTYLRDYSYRLHAADVISTSPGTFRRLATSRSG